MERGLALQAAVTWYPTIWRAHSQAWLPSGEHYAEVLMAISRGTANGGCKAAPAPAAVLFVVGQGMGDCSRNTPPRPCKQPALSR